VNPLIREALRLLWLDVTDRIWGVGIYSKARD